MREPKRLRDDPTINDELRGILDASSPLRPMSHAQRARARARIAGLAATPVAASAWLGFKGMALAATIGVSGALAVGAAPSLYDLVVASRVASPPAAPTEARASGASEQIPELDDEEPEAPRRTAESGPEQLDVAPVLVQRPANRGAAVPVPPSVSLPGDSTAVETDSDGTSDLSAEAALLERARATIERQPHEALAILDEHEQAFANGSLGTERELLRIDALRGLGRRAEARHLAEVLLRRAPGSLYEQRLRRMLDEM